MTARALGFASGLTIPGNVDLTQFVGSMVSNITAANSAISGLRANITAANSAITTANVGMKTYVDTQVASAIISASGYGNSVVAAYLLVNPTITSIQTNASSASANITSTQSNVTAANASITAANLNIASTQSNITAANSAITALRANITAANANIISLQSNTVYMTSNVGGSVFTNNVYLGTGNLLVGNINTRGNLSIYGSVAPTMRLVRSPDTNVTTGELYGNIDFAGEDSTSGASGERARISVAATDNTGGADMKFYLGLEGQAQGYPLTIQAPPFTINSSFFGGKQAVFSTQYIPDFSPTSPAFTPTSNDGLSNGAYINSVNQGAVVKQYSGAYTELDIGGTFIYNYAGFPGGDTANISLTTSAFVPPLGPNQYAITNQNWEQTDLEILVQGLYKDNVGAYKRLRKQWVATISYNTSTGNWSIVDQQLQSPVYNSDATNFAAGAVAAGKVTLVANVTAGYQAVYLRFDSPTSATVSSTVRWNWALKIRTISNY